MCDQRITYDDNVEPGRVVLCDDKDYFAAHEGECKEVLIERIENYAFEGEQIHWKVLVMDKNGVEKIKDVFMTIGSSQGAGNQIEANCKLAEPELTCCKGEWAYKGKKGAGCYEHVKCGKDAAESTEVIVVGCEGSGDYYGKERECNPSTCNARIDEEKIKEFNPQTMAYYDCLFTVETPNSMHGEYYITVEAVDLDDLSGTMAENEYWFLNPQIGLAIDGTLTFGNVRPGTEAYSDTMTITNDAEAGSGVLLDMFIAGTDFYDPASSGAKCPTTNQLALTNFAYFATNGAYSTQGSKKCTDDEGYSRIPYGDRITQGKEIIGCEDYNEGPYKAGNVLSPGAEMALTFRLKLPEPCNGDFSDGQIYFWGEAV